MSFEIKLTQGKVAFVDDGDLEIVSRFKWYAMRSKYTFYAASNGIIKGGVKRKTILMHALIMGCDLVDHKNGNGLNNSRLNLRKANKSLNAVNSRRRAGSSSKFRGVVWDSKRNKWAAYIKIDGKTKNLGRFQTESQASEAYRKIAIPMYGEFLRN